MVAGRRLMLAAALLLGLGSACDQGRRGAPQPVDFTIRPTAPSVPVGATIALRAVATYAGGEQVEVGGRVTWRSSASGVATIDASGTATGVTLGTTTVTATDPVTRLEHAVSLVVTPPIVATIAVTPPNPQFALGTTQQLVATATLTDGTTLDVTTDVAWTSEANGIATVDGTGLAASVAPGTATVTAMHAPTGVSATVSLTVTPAVLVALAVTPTSPQIALGTTQQFAATGTFSDGTVQDLTAQVQWSSSASGVASVGAAGLATSTATGTTAVRATHPGTGVFDETALTVTPAVLTALTVAPTTPQIALGTTQQFTATGTYSDATVQDLTDAVTWTSATPATATVGNAGGSEGLATSAAVGTTTIRATDVASGIFDETVLTVTPAVLVSLAVTPTAPSIALGTTQAFAATGTYSDATVQSLTDAVTWTSSTPATATISNAGGSEGLATSAAVGTTTIRATEPGSGVFDETVLTVTPAVLTSITVTPANTAIAVGATRQFTATGHYSDASSQDLTIAVTWSSSATAAATVSNAGGSEGLATGVAAGTTTITALHAGSGISGATSLDVFAGVELRGATSGGVGSGVLALSLTTPPATVAADVLLAAIAVRPQTAAVTPPSGWTLVRRSDNAAGAASSLLVYRRIATAGEPASHQWTFSASTGAAGGIAAFAWVDTTTPIDVENAVATPSAVVHTAPSVTSTAADAMLVTVHAFASAATWTSPPGMTEAFDVASDALGALGIALSAHFVAWPTAGATGARSATASNDADTGNAAAIVLRRRP